MPRTLLYPVKIGPIETRRGSSYVYSALGPRVILPPISAGSDELALRALDESVEEVLRRGEAEVVRVDAEHGWSLAALPDWAVYGRALLALGIGLGSAVERVPGLDLLADLVVASKGLADSKPWRLWHSDQALDVVIAGRPPRRFEASILGQDGQVRGVVLYSDPGAMARVSALMEEGRMKAIERMSSLTVVLEDKAPAFVLEALHHAFGVRVVPLPMKLRAGRRVPLDVRELATLTAVMRALASLGRDSLECRAVVSTRATRVAVAVRAPAPGGEGPNVPDPPHERPRRIGR